MPLFQHFKDTERSRRRFHLPLELNFFSPPISYQNSTVVYTPGRRDKSFSKNKKRLYYAIDIGQSFHNSVCIYICLYSRVYVRQDAKSCIMLSRPSFFPCTHRGKKFLFTAYYFFAILYFNVDFPEAIIKSCEDRVWSSIFACTRVVCNDFLTIYIRGCARKICDTAPRVNRYFFMVTISRLGILPA